MTRTIRRFGRSALIAGASLMLVSSTGLLAPPVLAATPPPPLVDCFGYTIEFIVPPPLYVPSGGGAFVGTDRADVIIGTDGPDHIFGGGGGDRICGGDGQDYIEGGTGDDRIDGEGHTDEIHGGEDDDTIYGGPNPPGGFHEALYGEEGADQLFGETGPDALICATPPDLPQTGDHGSGGTGMGNGAPEDDYIVLGTSCDTQASIP